MDEPASLYLHVPFCVHRCSYCDFNTYARMERMIPAYVDALCREIEFAAQAAPGRMALHTVFFGGGTPSLLPAPAYEQIFTAIRAGFDLLDGAEITIEANPGTVTLEYLTGLRRSGVNRLSFGMQSAHADDLRLLERQHDFFDVSQAVRWARKAGFDNLSLDLIFGLPEQPLERWQESIRRALGMRPEHLSLYGLTIEHGTPLEKRFRRGLIPVVDEDLAADMYESAIEMLASAGFEQYEISNWARDGKYALHNLQYWRNLPYLGLGAGAHGYMSGRRTANVGGILPYIQRFAAPSEQPPAFPATPATRRVLPIDRRAEMGETMMTGLRLTREGVSAPEFERRFGETLESAFGKEISYLLKAGLLEWLLAADGPRLRLTSRGVLLGNQVFSRFVGE